MLVIVTKGHPYSGTSPYPSAKIMIFVDNQPTMACIVICFSLLFCLFYHFLQNGMCVVLNFALKGASVWVLWSVR